MNFLRLNMAAADVRMEFKEGLHLLDAFLAG